MNSFINDEILNKLKKAQRGAERTPFSQKIEKQDFSNKMKDSIYIYNKIINDSEFFKCLLVLITKKFTWRNDLENNFDVNNKKVGRFIESMKKCGFIVGKKFHDLDDIYYEAILMTQPQRTYSFVNSISVITLTPEGEHFCNKVMDEISKLLIDRSDISFAYNEIVSKTKAFKVAFEKISKKENKISSRYIEYPDGTIIKRDTIIESQRQDKIKKDIKVGMLELKRELLLEHDPNSKQIAIIENKKNELVLQTEPEEIKKHEYSGVYSHLNSVELEELTRPVSKEEAKQVEKTHKQEIKEKMNRIKQINKYESKYSLDKVCNKKEETLEEERANKRECVGFLNSLKACD